ncbi:hypothetical protein GCM10028895_47620 [Pontibacter rugosus]
MGARVLKNILVKGQGFITELQSASVPLGLLDEAKTNKKKLKNTNPVSNPVVDHVIVLEPEWEESGHKHKIKYFIPEWDDLVDPDYDFENDMHSGLVPHWSNEVYAHQMYSSPNYDGILISRVVVEQNKKRKELLDALGVHRSLRVPDRFPVMGDCGAFGYITKEKPPYSTEDVLDYYTRYGFNLGVSVDHLIVNGTKDSALERYQLTIQNAEDFLKEHRQQGLPWRPIGAVQGWDPKSYAEAVEQYVKMGYDYLALGGLVRTTTKDMMAIIQEVSKVVPKGVDLHLFGIARLNALREMYKYGVTSVDSASHLRKAWLGANDNYWTLDGNKYSAIRIPGEGSARYVKILKSGEVSEAELKKLAKSCLNALRDYDTGKIALEDVMVVLDPYSNYIIENKYKEKERKIREEKQRTTEQKDREIQKLKEYKEKEIQRTLKEYKKTLQAKPWQQCKCDICKKDGVDVIIFRGNNRNRRRGFHNTYVFYSLLKRILTDQSFFIDNAHRLFETQMVDSETQLELFGNEYKI